MNDLTLVLHSPERAAFDERISADATVGDLIDRVKRRIHAEPGSRIRLIAAGAVLDPLSQVREAVRARAGVSVYHLHFAMNAPELSQPDAASTDLPQACSNSGIALLDDRAVISRNRSGDLIWGFAIGYTALHGLDHPSLPQAALALRS